MSHQTPPDLSTLERGGTRGPLGVCQWFIRCNRPATGTTPHPILGDVPTCDRCAAFATGAPMK